MSDIPLLGAHYFPLLATGYACSCSSREFLLRKDIFDLEKAVVIETPQLGHATYVFAKPRSMEGFLVLYTRITKGDILAQSGHRWGALGLLGRVIHGMNPRAGFKEMRQRLGEKTDSLPRYPTDSNLAQKCQTLV